MLSSQGRARKATTPPLTRKKYDTTLVCWRGVLQIYLPARVRSGTSRHLKAPATAAPGLIEGRPPGRRRRDGARTITRRGACACARGPELCLVHAAWAPPCWAPSMPALSVQVASLARLTLSSVVPRAGVSRRVSHASVLAEVGAREHLPGLPLHQAHVSRIHPVPAEQRFPFVCSGKS